MQAYIEPPWWRLVGVFTLRCLMVRRTIIRTFRTHFLFIGAAKKKSGMREKQAIYRKSTASTTYESREEALSDAICCDNSINKGSRAGPCVALAHV